MIAAVVYFTVVSTFVAIAARGTDELLRLTGRQTRWAWAAGLLTLVVLAAWMPLRRTAAAPAGIPVAAVARTVRQDAAPAHSVLEGTRRTLVAARHFVADLPARLVDRLHLRAPGDSVRMFGWIWGTMSTALVALLAIAYLRFRNAVRRLPTLRMHGESVHVSPTAGPAVVGIRRPAIVVPVWLLDAGSEEQALAVAHEREHRAARDPVLLIAGCLAVAVLPWNPAAWWMLARLRLAVEIDCDRRVLARGVARRTYGAALIDIAARCARLPLGVPALADHTTQLERRLIAMTPAPVSFRRTRTLGLAAAAVLTFVAACEARLPSSPEIERMDVAAVESNSMTRVALGSDTTLTYYIDGKQVTSAEARTLPPERIASIEVVKAAAAGGTSSIQITTHERAESAATATARLGQTDVATGRTELTGDVKLRSTERFLGLVLIDGVRSDAAALATLAPDRIASMEILKGAAASRQYSEPEAQHGVILVVTKRSQ